MNYVSLLLIQCSIAIALDFAWNLVTHSITSLATNIYNHVILMDCLDYSREVPFCVLA